MGSTQTERISRAQADTARIGLQTSQAQEPMQMYLDTDSSIMTLRPIFEFPLDTATQAVDPGQLTFIANTILDLLSTTFPAKTALSPVNWTRRRSRCPQRCNRTTPTQPALQPAADASAPAGNSTGTTPAATVVQGKIVTNLAPNAIGTSATASTPSGVRPASSSRRATPHRPPPSSRLHRLKSSSPGALPAKCR